jgi:hypothetical protein
MYANLFVAKCRLSQVAETLLADYVGMMAPIVVEEVFSLVAATKPQSEQQMLAEFFLNLRKVLPADLDAEKLIDSLCAHFEQD